MATHQFCRLMVRDVISEANRANVTLPRLTDSSKLSVGHYGLFFDDGSYFEGSGFCHSTALVEYYESIIDKAVEEND